MRGSQRPALERMPNTECMPSTDLGSTARCRRGRAGRGRPQRRPGEWCRHSPSRGRWRTSAAGFDGAWPVKSAPTHGSCERAESPSRAPFSRASSSRPSQSRTSSSRASFSRASQSRAPQSVSDACTYSFGLFGRVAQEPLPQREDAVHLGAVLHRHAHRPVQRHRRRRERVRRRALVRRLPANDVNPRQTQRTFNAHIRARGGSGRAGGRAGRTDVSWLCWCSAAGTVADCGTAGGGASFAVACKYSTARHAAYPSATTVDTTMSAGAPLPPSKSAPS